MRTALGRAGVTSGLRYVYASTIMYLLAFWWLRVDRPFIDDAPKLYNGLITDAYSRLVFLFCFSVGCMLHATGNTMVICAVSSNEGKQQLRKEMYIANFIALCGFYFAASLVATGLLFGR